MTELDRAAVIDLLGRLGAENDETVLNAARELHRTVRESGVSWDELLPHSLSGADAAAEVHDERLDDSPVEPAEPDGAVSDADKNDAARLIDRLLARKTLSDTLRADLVELKRAIVEGNFDAVDRRYIRALARRLGA